MQIPKITLPYQFTSLPKAKKIEITVVSILMVALIPTIFAAKTIQDLRSKASEKKAVISCSKADVDFLGVPPDKQTASILLASALQTDQELDKAIREYMQWERQHEKAMNPHDDSLASLDVLRVQTAYAANNSCKKDNDCNNPNKVCKGGKCEAKQVPPPANTSSGTQVNQSGGKSCNKDNDCGNNKTCKQGHCEEKNGNGGGGGNGGGNDNDKKKRLLDNIRELAVSRKELVIGLMYNDPTQAINVSRGDRNKEGYYLLEDNCKVVQKSQTGEVALRHYDLKNKTSRQEYVLITDAGDEIEIHTANATPDQLKVGATVTVQGLSIDDEMVIDQSISAVTTPKVLAKAVLGNSPASLGDQKTLVIFAQYKNTPVPDNIQGQRDAILARVNDYYREVSYGKTQFSFKPTNWVKMDIPRKDNSCRLGKATKAMKEEVYRQVNFKNYDRFLFVAPYGQNCDWLGVSWTGKVSVKTPDGKVRASISWVDVDYVKAMTPDQGMREVANTTIHELGHALGVNHAQSLDCTNGGEYLNGTCYVQDYGDRTSIMGSSTGHFTAPHKEILGWFSNGNIRTVTEGIYTIEPIETNTSGLKAIKIPRGSNDFLFVEYRQPIGFDARDSFDPTDTRYYNPYNGANLHVYGFDPVKSTGTNRVPDRLASAQLKNSIGGWVIPVGASVTDPVSGSSVLVKSLSPAGLTVQVFPRGSVTPTPTLGVTISTPTVIYKPTNIPTPTQAFRVCKNDRDCQSWEYCSNNQCKIIPPVASQSAAPTILITPTIFLTPTLSPSPKL